MCDLETISNVQVNIFSGFCTWWAWVSSCQATGWWTFLPLSLVQKVLFKVFVSQSFSWCAALMRPRWTTPCWRPLFTTPLLDPQQGLLILLLQFFVPYAFVILYKISYMATPQIMTSEWIPKVVSQNALCNNPTNTYMSRSNGTKPVGHSIYPTPRIS